MTLQRQKSEERLQYERIQTWLNVCEDELEKLTEFEREFVESVSDQFTQKGTLSERQQAVLKEIYDKVV